MPSLHLPGVVPTRRDGQAASLVAGSPCGGPVGATGPAQVSAVAPHLQYFLLGVEAGGEGSACARRGGNLAPGRWIPNPQHNITEGNDTVRREEKSAPPCLRHCRGKKASLKKKNLIEPWLRSEGVSAHSYVMCVSSLTLLTKFPADLLGIISYCVPIAASQPSSVGSQHPSAGSQQQFHCALGSFLLSRYFPRQQQLCH